MSWATDMAALSPTGWWRLGEASGSFADSGSGSHASSSVGSGVAYGATGLVTGDSNKAVTLDGSANAWIDFGDVDDLDGGSYTVMFAFKLDGGNASNYRRLLNKYNAGVTDGIEIGFLKSTDSPANALYFDHKVSSTTKEATSAALASGTKYLAFCVYDASADTMKVYVNGAQSGSTVTGVTSDLSNNTGSLIFGNNQGKLLAAAFSGTMDEAAIWKGTALSGSQIASLYLSFDPPADQNIAAGLASETDSGLAATVDLSPVLSASGTVLGVAAGADEYGRAILKCTQVESSSAVAVIEQSADGSTFADVTSHCTTHQSGSDWLIGVNRPDKGSQAMAAGGTAYYRVKLTKTAGGTTSYSNVVAVSGVGLTRATVEQDYAQAIKTYLDTSANANAEADGAYPGVFLTALAYAKAAGYTPSSGDYLTVCSSFWSLIKSRGNINADYLHTPATYSGSTGIRRDFHFRLVVHLIVAARILRDNVGGSTATTLASDMLDYANRMAKAAFDKLGTGTLSSDRLGLLGTGSDGMSVVTAWAANTTVALGEVRKSTAGGTRTFRVTAVTGDAKTGSSEPTWPTSEAGTVTDNHVTWTEQSYSVPAAFYSSYWSTSPYTATGSGQWDGNQCSEIAAALLLLRAEPTSDFKPGGSYATTGYNHAVAMLRWCAVFQYTDGAIPVGGGYNTRDTHYGSFQLHTTAMALHAIGGSGVVAQADLWLLRALAWFTNVYSSEPGVSNATANGTGTGYATYHRLAEPVWRAAGFEVAGLTDPLDGLYYTSSYLQGTDTIYTEWGYTPENAAYPYAYFFEALADYMAVIGRQDVAVDQASETDTGLGATPSGATSVAAGIASETDTGLDIVAANAAIPGEPEGGLAFLFPVRNVEVPVSPGTETDSGLGITPRPDQFIPADQASETDAGLDATPIAPFDQSVAVDLPVEVDEALEIAGTALAVGVITLNMQMPPGTVVGAYLTHEWRGHLVPMRRAGSYPGPVQEEQAVDAYGEVTFGSLAPGEYVAWAADFPLRRRFFMVES